jgi:hypothetical protein
MELGSERRVAFVHCLNVVKEHGKRHSVVEGMVKDNDEIILVGGDVTKVDWGTMKCVLDIEAEAANETSPPTLDRFPLLCGPLEVERRMYGLRPTTDLNREVE